MVFFSVDRFLRASLMSFSRSFGVQWCMFLYLFTVSFFKQNRIPISSHAFSAASLGGIPSFMYVR